MLQVVARVVDQMPSDAIVEIEKDKGEQSRASCHDRHPSLSIQVTHGSKPRAGSSGCILTFAFIGPEGITSGCATSIRRLKLVWNAEAWNFNAFESKLLNHSPD